MTNDGSGQGQLFAAADTPAAARPRAYPTTVHETGRER